MVAPFPTDKVFIGGVWRPAVGDATLPIENPSTGQVMGRLAAGTAADVDAAVRAARAAFEGDWGRLSAVERGRIPGGGAGGLGHGAGVEGDVGPVGDLDERVDAGHALGDVAEVGAGGDRLGQDPGGQGVASPLALLAIVALLAGRMRDVETRHPLDT